MLKESKVIDAHLHYSPQTGPEVLLEMMKKTATDGVVIQSVSHSQCLSLLPGSLVMKHMGGESCYVFASPDLSGYYLNPEDLGRYFAEYTARMLEAGADGVKLLEGKPQMRKAHPIPDFDAKCWEPYWEYLESNQVPVTWHVNDPEKHWSRDVSDWVKKQGWWYDESYINNEVQYAQVLNVLKYHKYLRIIFAHFFFLSAQLERLDDIMERFPNVMVDLTPGIEMYENFSAEPEKAAAFFEKYQSRIIYGTDIGGRCILTNEGEPFNVKENMRRPEIVRDYLTTTEEQVIASDGNFLIQREPFVMRGLGLSGDRLGKILAGNIESQIGCKPNKICAEAVLEFNDYLRSRMAKLAEVKKDFQPDCSELARAKRYFH